MPSVIIEVLRAVWPQNVMLSEFVYQIFRFFLDISAQLPSRVTF